MMKYLVNCQSIDTMKRFRFLHPSEDGFRRNDISSFVLGNSKNLDSCIHPKTDSAGMTLNKIINMQKSKYILTIIAMILISCSSAPKQANCVKESEKDLLINWGTKYNKTGWRVYHAINSKMIMMKVEEDSLGNKRYSDSTRISEENYCSIKQDLVNFVVKTQAMAFPGIVQQFVEYNSPGQNVYFQAIWNPEHTNAGNKELRVFFDSLDYRAK